MLRRVSPEEEKFYVYVHSRPSNGEPFYIGKGNGKRARKRDGRTLHWRNIVKKEGGFHISFLTRNVEEDLAILAEVEAIDLFRRRGCSLINLTDGGEGVTGREFPAAMRARYSEERKGKPLSEATRAAAVAFHKGRKQSPEEIANRVAKLIGKRRTPEQRAAMSARQIGVKKSDEARANMSKARYRVLARLKSQDQDSLF